MQIVGPALIFVLGSVISSGQDGRFPGNPQSVCELITHRTEYNGRLVTVRAEVKAGGHGLYLAPLSECKNKLVTRGVEWPNLIFLDYPDNQSRDQTKHASFRVDELASRRAAEQIRAADPSSQIVGTYVGLFVTYADLENRVSPGVPGALRLGFGPVGLEAPAQLLIKTVKNIAIIRVPVR